MNLNINRFSGIIQGDLVEWQKWLKPSELARVVPAETLAAECKANILLGRDAEIGLTLPWSKTTGKVLIRPGKLALWTGFSHHGKSNLLKQLMLHAISQGEKVLIASMEESITDVWTDLCQMYTGTDSPSPRVIDNFIHFITGQLWLYDQNGVVEGKRMQAVIRYASETYHVTQAVIDSLMMLAVDRGDYEAQSKFIGELKAVAKDTKATVHLVAHMRKSDSKNGDDVPGNVHDIAGGHEIASKADYVFGVWRNKQNKLNTPAALLDVMKQRGYINYLGKFGLEFHEKSRQFVEDARNPNKYDGASRETDTPFGDVERRRAP